MAAAAAAMAAQSNGNGSAVGTGSLSTHPGLASFTLEHLQLSLRP